MRPLSAPRPRIELWRRMSFADRGALMTRAAELIESEVPVIAELMTLEMWQDLRRGEGGRSFHEVRRHHALLRRTRRRDAPRGESSDEGVRAAECALTRSGPIFAVMPWNFPWWQVIRMAVPTLMAGNVVVFKHAPNVPGNAKYLEDLFVRAGFAPGVLTSVFVDIEQVPDIIADDRIVAVTLTGSERAGRSVAEHAGKNLKKCVLELGGSDPFIIAGSADLGLTVPGAVAARIQNNGQACIAAKRFIVVRERADEFIERYSAAMGAVRLGDPMDPATELGPLVSRSQRDLLDAQVASSIEKGAQALVGGFVPEQAGFYYPATVLVEVPEDTRAACEELFGPVSVVHVARDLTDALRIANDTPWGLGASVWAQDGAEIDQAIADLEVGTVFANAMVASMNELPFGGTKRSGFGRELSAYGAREFTNAKSFFVA